jgi:hypothetical protein
VDIKDYVLIEDNSARLAYTCEDRPRIYFAGLFPISTFIVGSVWIAVRPAPESWFLMIVPLLCFILFMCLWKMDKIWVDIDIKGKRINVIERLWLERRKRMSDIQFDEIEKVVLTWPQNNVFILTHDEDTIRIFFGNVERCKTVAAHIEAILRGDEVAGKLHATLEDVDAKERVKDKNGKICCGIVIGCLILAFLLIIWNEMAF